MKRKLAVALASILAMTCTSGAQALGLGNIEVNSKLNQPLNASIRLLNVDLADQNDVSIKLASVAAFQRAGLQRPPVLATLRFSPFSPLDNNRGVITISTAQPIKEPFLNFLVEVNWSQGRVLREYTVLLDPPTYRADVAPIQAQPPKPVAAAPVDRVSSRTISSRPENRLSGLSAAAVADSSNSSRLLNAEGSSNQPAHNVKKGDNLWVIAERMRQGTGASHQQMMTALFNANRNAFIRGNMNLLRTGRTLQMPTEAELAAVSSSEASKMLSAHKKEWNELRESASAKPSSAAASKAPIESGDDGDSTAMQPMNAGSGRLIIGGAGDQTRAVGGAGSEEGTALRAQITSLKEENKRIEQENKQLAEDLKTTRNLVEDLQKQVDKLLKVQSDFLAQLERQARQQQAASANANPVTTPPTNTAENTAATPETNTTESAATAATQVAQLDPKVAGAANTESPEQQPPTNTSTNTAASATGDTPPSTTATNEPATTTPTSNGAAPPATDSTSPEQPVSTEQMPSGETDASGSLMPAGEKDDSDQENTAATDNTAATSQTDAAGAGTVSPANATAANSETKPKKFSIDSLNGGSSATDNKTDAPIETDATTDTGAEATAPATTSPVATETAAVTPPAEAPQTPETAAQSEPSIMDTVNGVVDSVPGGWLTLGGGAGALLLLFGGLGWAKRRREAKQEEDVQRELERLEAEEAAHAAAADTAHLPNTDLNSSNLDNLDDLDLQTSTEPDEVLEEIEILLAYDRFNEAQHRIETALASDPDNPAYLLKRLEVDKAMNDAGAFAAHAQPLQEQTGGRGHYWQEALKLWENLGTGRTLVVAGVAAGAAGAAGALAGAAVLGENTDDASLGVDDLDFNLGEIEDADTQTNEATLDFDLADLGATDNEQNTDLDMDLGNLEDLDGLAGADDTDSKTSDMDRDLDMLAGETSDDLDMDFSLDANDGDDDLSMGLDESADTDGLNLDLGDLGDHSANADNELDLNLDDDMSLNLDEEETLDLGDSSADDGNELDLNLDDDMSLNLGEEETLDLGDSSTDDSNELDLNLDDDMNLNLGEEETLDLGDSSTDDSNELDLNLDDDMSLNLGEEETLDLGDSSADDGNELDLNLDDDMSLNLGEEETLDLGDSSTDDGNELDLNLDDSTSATDEEEMPLDLGEEETINLTDMLGQTDGDLELNLGEGIGLDDDAEETAALEDTATDTEDEFALDLDDELGMDLNNEATEDDLLDLDTTDSTEMADLAEPTAEATEDDLDLDNFGLDAEDSAAEEFDMDMSETDADELDLDSTDDLDMSFEEESTVLEMDSEENELNLDSDLDLDELGKSSVDELDESATDFTPAELEASDLDFSGDDDLDDLLSQLDDESNSAFGGDLGGSTNDIEGKFNLAQMYLDMDDAASARSMLQEIMHDGNESDRTLAAQMLQDIPETA